MKTVKIIIALAILLVLGPAKGGCESPGPSESGPASRKPDSVIRILGIGNSFTVDAFNEYLHELAAADGRRLVVAHLTAGGATLEEHADNARSNRPVYTICQNGG